jgi:hypothetical protein
MDQDEPERRADELLAAERQVNARERGRAVPFLLRSADSRRLTRQREWELFRQARTDVFATPATSLAIVLAPIALGCFFALFAHHPISAFYVLAWLIALAIPFGLYVLHVRRALAKLARGES